MEAYVFQERDTEMKYFVMLIMLILAVLITISGCSITHNVNTDSTKAFKKDLMKATDTIKSVDITFTRPSVTYKVNMEKEPTQEVLDTILSKAKSFTTVENIDEIARKVGWLSRVSRVYIRINTDNDDAIEYEYYTSYFKTARAEDTEGNIDAYQTWNSSSQNSVMP